jgi:hypothetical protein
MKLTFKTIITAAALAGVSAAFINSLLYFIFHASGIIPDNVFIQENQPLTVVPVIISSVVPSLLAGIVFYLLCRYTSKGYRIFSIIALLLLVLSFANPFMSIPGIPLAMGLALNAMHVVVVASLLYFFRGIKGAESKVALQ